MIQLSDRMVEIIEEALMLEMTAKIPMSSIDDFDGLINELEQAGYDWKLSPSTDYLIISR